MASGSSRPASVRNLYNPPAEEWVFLPPTVSPPPSASPPTPSHLPTPFSSPLPEPDEGVNPRIYGLLQIFAAEYFTTAVGMPFEVGKTLLQIEYRPRQRFAPTKPESSEVAQKDWLADEAELNNPEEADVYFTERLSGPSSTSFIPPPPPEPLVPADASGYLPDLHPSWMLNDDPEISRGNGVWGMMRRLRLTPSEGLPSLWKSQLITTFHSMLVSLIQPHVHTTLLGFFPTTPPFNPDVPLSALPSPGVPLALGVTSHLLTHLVLSPMEVIRTRLIAMPISQPSTPSSIAMFRQMLSEEGGLANLYLNSNLLIPSILEHILRPLFTLSVPLILERQFSISPELSPITYATCDLALGIASLVVLLPIETVRKRLQIQARGNSKRIKSIVALRDRDYVGVVEAMWRIVTEETGVRRKRVMSERDEGGLFAGIRQLYRGFGMAATAHLTVFGLGLVSASMGGSGFDSGWKEI
ncbi:mitochondrial carrier domain-containing protein [Kockovaella imperatae]|uniref:Mitochondrial carrier domain-containing protein n=1 Tax=Kockovaella imperatae TaxID=4999 RepID=A0A1Y1UP85_9TREE|nr:mitochondrial carrier domain-containing protein [Kockovaella imperatae]ORX38935.1 mitochondrial carrier domain-containing protein [Kockovaella imperatae]